MFTPLAWRQTREEGPLVERKVGRREGRKGGMKGERGNEGGRGKERHGCGVSDPPDSVKPPPPPPPEPQSPL